jgi:hypothetical protein
MTCMFENLNISNLITSIHGATVFYLFLFLCVLASISNNSYKYLHLLVLPASVTSYPTCISTIIYRILVFITDNASWLTKLISLWLITKSVCFNFVVIGHLCTSQCSILLKRSKGVNKAKAYSPDLLDFLSWFWFWHDSSPSVVLVALSDLMDLSCKRVPKSFPKLKDTVWVVALCQG